jgi:oligopeptide/dipeptide ABC transporter ATP-binding protein
VNGSILSLQELSIHYSTFDGTVKAVDRATLDLPTGKVVGLVGESGCGKSTLGLSILRLVRPPGGIAGGKIVFEDEDLVTKKESEMRAIRGSRIAMVFQDPMTSLNPLVRIDRHFLETIASHGNGMSKDQAMERIETLVERLGISRSRLHEFPHQLSGGMRQRIMIGLGLIMHPRLIIADEPTNSLDVIVEAHFLDLLNDLKEEYNLTILLITHNMGIVAELADRVAVMYAGTIVEEGDVFDLFKNPLHPYTKGLLASIPNIKLDQSSLYTMSGSPPNLIDPPTGCSFHPRCPEAMDICRQKEPRGITESGRRVECFLYGKGTA